MGNGIIGSGPSGAGLPGARRDAARRAGRAIRRLAPAALLWAALLAGAPGSAKLSGSARAPADVAAQRFTAVRLAALPPAQVDLAVADPQAGNGFRVTVTIGGHAYVLPPPDEPLDFFEVHARAVMFADVDPARHDGRELIVLYAAQKRAPGEDLYHAACVYRWTGRGFARMPEAEERLGDAPDAAAVRARLRTPA